MLVAKKNASLGGKTQTQHVQLRRLDNIDVGVWEGET